jgi:2-oxoglutarate ferredoxin oxidoreductase subunit beta
MLRWYKENSIPVERARKVGEQEKAGKIVVGILHDVERTEFCEEYYKLISKLRKEQRKEAA